MHKRPSLQLAAVNTHAPDWLEQKSVVQGSSSSHTTGAKMQSPVTGSHVSSVQLS